MKKTFSELMNKSVKELEKEVDNLNNEIIKGSMELASSPQKDSNIFAKKRRKIAVISTAINQKKTAEKLNNTKKL
jgi:ribosomal protein L29